MLTRTKQAVVALAVAIVAVAVPGVAHAANGSIILVTHTSASGAKTTAFTGSTALYSGDCSMNVPSFVTINPPTAAGTVLVQWEGWGYTRHTNNADYWNLYLNFTDAYGSFIVSAPAMRGAAMTTWYQTYGWDRYVSFSLSAAQFNRIAQIEWIGTC